jgi:hypothetical protein
MNLTAHSLCHRPGWIVSVPVGLVKGRCSGKSNVIDLKNYFLLSRRMSRGVTNTRSLPMSPLGQSQPIFVRRATSALALKATASLRRIK